MNLLIFWLYFSTGSVGYTNFGHQINFVANLARQLEVESGKTRIAALSFGTNTEVGFTFDRYTKVDEVRNGLSKLRYMGGTTDTAKAIRTATENIFDRNGDRSNVRNVMVLIGGKQLNFTNKGCNKNIITSLDGSSNNIAKTTQEAAKARLRGITILSVAASNWVNRIEMAEIASDPDQFNVFNSTRFRELSSVSSSLTRAVCNSKYSSNKTYKKYFFFLMNRLYFLSRKMLMNVHRILA